MYRTTPSQLAEVHIAGAVKELVKTDSRFQMDNNALTKAAPLAELHLSKHITTEQHAMLRQLWAGGNATDADVLEVVTFVRPETVTAPDQQQRSFHVQRLRHEINQNDERQAQFRERVAQRPNDQALQRDLQDIKDQGARLREHLNNWQEQAA
jgi:hypothetical protein